ncbi:DUF3050 domain-containing protein [Aquirufa sp.]|jgi:hypothetical protein|uniref:DUF3050 domain-containing protein n=1 Tax=Aquirufa sp. TaxID=2676249 RepID=UPI0037BE9437
MSQINSLREQIKPYQEALYHHPINSYIKSHTELAVFMQHHVFAVWDFMSLVKKLQAELTCVSQPWVPKGSADVRFLINEIVLGEESDVDQHGVVISHFELYLRAMKELSIEPSPILSNLLQAQSLVEILQKIANTSLAPSIKQFLKFTFESIANRPIEEIAAIFTFGREDLIPGMFQLIVDQLKQDSPDQVETLVYYLERHIEVDGDHHSQLAYRMMEELCGDDADKWQRAANAAIDSLKVRKVLWDGVVGA